MKHESRKHERTKPRKAAAAAMKHESRKHERTKPRKGLTVFFRGFVLSCFRDSYYNEPVAEHPLLGTTSGGLQTDPRNGPERERDRGQIVLRFESNDDFERLRLRQ
jgi:hypothetical protein